MIYTLFKVVLSHASTRRFYLASIFGFSFSIAVILCTLGLMDGFEFGLKSGLRKSSSDYIVSNSQELFSTDKLSKLKEKVQGIDVVAPVLQVQAMIASDQARGVVVKGVDSSFSLATGLDIRPANGVVIGKELSLQLGVSRGDYLMMMFPSGGKNLQGMPEVFSFEVVGIISHGIHEKDLRYVYLEMSRLQELLGFQDKINTVSIKLMASVSRDEALFAMKKNELRDYFGDDFRVKAYWNEFANLLEAVEVEKLSITMILQVIVLVSVFNIFALIIFMGQKNAKEFFLFRALGVKLRDLSRLWFAMLFVMWMLAFILARGLTALFDYALSNFSWLEVPGEVYVLSRFQILLDWQDYAVVASISLFWIVLIYFIGKWRFVKRGLLHGLRQEFN